MTAHWGDGLDEISILRELVCASDAGDDYD
jgi:hypothetical protein